MVVHVSIHNIGVYYKGNLDIFDFNLMCFDVAPIDQSLSKIAHDFVLIYKELIKRS